MMIVCQSSAVIISLVFVSTNTKERKEKKGRRGSTKEEEERKGGGREVRMQESAGKFAFWRHLEEPERRVIKARGKSCDTDHP
jgi:hypothetical protein